MILTDESLLDRFRGPGYCEMPHRAFCSHRQVHHWKCRGAGGGSRLDVAINLISLCPLPCHYLVQHSKELNAIALRAIARREKTTPEAIEETLNFLLRLDKDAPEWRVQRALEELEGEAHRLARGILLDLGMIIEKGGAA